MRTVVGIVNLAVVAAQLGHTNYRPPDDWGTMSMSGGSAAVWEPDAAQWWRDGLNGTVSNTFQPNVPVDMFAGRPFRLTLELDEAATSSRQWKVRQPLPDVVREVLGISRPYAGLVHFDLLAADVVPSDDSGYLVVGYTHAREWYTQPVAIKLYESEQAVVRQTGTSTPVDDTEIGFSGFFFILFCTCDVLIIVGLGSHYVLYRDTWKAPLESDNFASATPSGDGRAMNSRETAHAEKASRSEAQHTDNGTL